MAFTNLLDVIYPVGSVYFSSMTTSPAETIGGTWTQVSGRYLKADTTPMATGGSDTFSYSYGLDYPSYYGVVGEFDDGSDYDYERYFGFWDETKGTFEAGTYQRLNKTSPYINGGITESQRVVNGTQHFGGHITIEKPLSPSYYSVCCWVRIS